MKMNGETDINGGRSVGCGRRHRNPTEFELDLTDLQLNRKTMSDNQKKTDFRLTGVS